ncbi:outer membrane surface antigen [Bradyrhizobium arachidis]|nr:outer membrane surface antigen [Bradyrhizobium arachidis]
MRPAAQNALLSAPTLYRAWGRVGLSAIHRSGLVVTIILIGLGAGGCSFSRNDKTAYAKADDSDLTGSIARKDAPPTETDLAFARNAASDVLSKGDKDSSQHWENPETGARGSVTPIAQSYAAEDGRKCRDFLASYVNGSTESWLQGAGCQSSHGRWEIHTLKPWRS